MGQFLKNYNIPTQTQKEKEIPRSHITIKLLIKNLNKKRL